MLATRRSILQALGIGTAALISEPLTQLTELTQPRKKLWFVPSTAPVSSRIERVYKPLPLHPDGSINFDVVDEPFTDYAALEAAISDDLHREMVDRVNRGYEFYQRCKASKPVNIVFVSHDRLGAALAKTMEVIDRLKET